jgi:hypothetical protein
VSAHIESTACIANITEMNTSNHSCCPTRQICSNMSPLPLPCRRTFRLRSHRATSQELKSVTSMLSRTNSLRQVRHIPLDRIHFLFSWPRLALEAPYTASRYRLLTLSSLPQRPYHPSSRAALTPRSTSCCYAIRCHTISSLKDSLLAVSSIPVYLPMVIRSSGRSSKRN